jgi:hypothetical protein
MAVARITPVVAVVLATAAATGAGQASNFAEPPTPLQAVFVIVSVLFTASLALRDELAGASSKKAAEGHIGPYWAILGYGRGMVERQM